jgi:magnesium chelatase subunit D
LVALLLSIDPHGLGGVSLRGPAGLVRDAWLGLLRACLPMDAPFRRLPIGISEGRLLGGLDLAATLRAGRPVGERGLLAEADGGVVVAAMAERILTATAAQLSAALDTGLVTTARDGIASLHPARIGVVALDEGITDDERPPAALLDRMAFLLDFFELTRVGEDPEFGLDDLAAARVLLPHVTLGEEALSALVGTAVVLGVDSLRASLMAMRVAKAAAALHGRNEVAREDAALAARLVLGPRATRLPPPPQDQQAPEDQPPEEAPPEEPPPPTDNSDQPADDQEEQEAPQALEDLVLQAARAAIPPGLLEQLRAGKPPLQSRSSGKAGAMQKKGARGRPTGIRKGPPAPGARLNLVETLRAAAPWQRLRRAEHPDGHAMRVHVRSDDFHVTRFRPRTETTTIFAVDASGSAAASRLAEAKGAVELLLADCYVRRDQVAVIGFRGTTAEILLPPTRSLVRAKRALAGLPGGGGTPIATGLGAALALADQIRRRGQTPTIVMLTDGRANVGRDGSGGRAKAQAEAMDAARQIRLAGLAALLVDISPRPAPQGQDLAGAMGARYVALPYADAELLSKAVRVVTAETEGRNGRSG